VVAYKSALKWFPAGSSDPVDYQGGRDLDSLAKLSVISSLKRKRTDRSVTEKSGAKSKIKPPAPSAAVEVTAGNFDDIVLNEDKDVLVAFTAPWVCRLSSFNRFKLT
jgi:protein disulfide-isomerase A6